MDDVKQLINIPSSKSYAQRLIICSALCCDGHRSIILHNVNMCNDVKSCINAMQLLGASIEYTHNGEVIISKGISFNEIIHSKINIGESGTTCRIMIPILASFENMYTISGEGSIMKRDMSSCKEIFKDNPVYYKMVNNNLPISVFGALTADEYNLDGSATSQYISGLLIAYAYHNKSCRIKVSNCGSYGYIKITLDVLINIFGMTNITVHECDDKLIDIEIIRDDTVSMQPPKEIDVEADWSSFGAIYLAASLLSNDDGGVLIGSYGVNDKSVQPDYDILYNGWYLFGNVKMNNNKTIGISKIEVVKPFVIDISNTPDLFPYYAGFATLCEEDYCEIQGLHKLVNKESNRGQVIYDELINLGFNCKIEEDSIFIKKGKEFLDKPYNSHNDHRIGQTLAIIKLFNGGHIKENDMSINKSYPDFIKDIEKIYDKRIRTFI